MPKMYETFPDVQPSLFKWREYADGKVWVFGAEDDAISDLDAFTRVAQRWAEINGMRLDAKMYAPISVGEQPRIAIRFTAPAPHAAGATCPMWSRCKDCWPDKP